LSVPVIEGRPVGGADPPGAGSLARRVEGWALVGAAGLTPVLGWLGPLGFALLVTLVGLVSVSAMRFGRREWPLFALLGLAAGWAALSTLWSPYQPDDLEANTALKLALQLPLYWAAWCAARRADPDLRRRALRVFAWGLAGFGVVLLAEALTGAAGYQAVRALIGDPIRPDLAQKNVAQGSFVLALLWPVAFVGGWRAGAPAWLALPMAAGTALLAQQFRSDAALLAVGVALAAGAIALVWPRSGPKLMGLGAAATVLGMPLVIMALQWSGVGGDLPESWRQRMAYWFHALDRIDTHPWRGWGVDASRTFGPDIQLHPHNGPLQLWLELGVLGAALGALVWIVIFRQLARETRSLLAAATAGSAAVYVLFGLVSFGAWQEWWLALGAWAATIAALAHREESAITT
jgi:O-antigen ligase